jgi:hypothetical protein
MHLDIYHQDKDPIYSGCCLYQDDDPVDECWFCHMHRVLRPAELWCSLCIIIAPVTEINFPYVNNRILRSFENRCFSSLHQLAVVPHRNAPDAFIAGDCYTLPKFLKRVEVRDLILANLTIDYDRDEFDPHPPATNTHLRSLTLENISIGAFELFRSLELSGLRELIITSADVSCDTDDLSEMTRALASVETAKLEFQDFPIVEAILSALVNVRYLELCSDDTTIWPQALTDSRSCTKLESIVFHHSVTFVAVQCVARTRSRVLKSIEVPHLFEVPRGEKISHIPVHVKRTPVHQPPLWILSGI